MLRKILVPLDGSQVSQRSLEPALVLSRQTGAELLLLVSVPTADTLNFAVSEARQHELAQDAPVCLFNPIAMATHGHTGLKRRVCGGVTATVLRSASCSTLVVQPTDAELN